MKVASLPHRGHRASALSSLKAPIRILLEHKKGLTLFPCGAGAGGAAWDPGNFFVGATLRGCPLLGGHAGPPLRARPGNAVTGPATKYEKRSSDPLTLSLSLQGRGLCEEPSVEHTLLPDSDR